MKISNYIGTIFNNIFESKPQPTPSTWDTLLKHYVFDTTSLPKDDYVAKIMRETPIFKQDTTPLSPIIHNQGGDTFMHYKTLGLLLLLHKLHIRPSV